MPETNKTKTSPEMDDETLGFVSSHGNSRSFIKRLEPQLNTPILPESYTILNKIGQGGMGEVYLARQGSPERLVAFKLIRFHSMSQPIIARFEAEYKLLGMMNHHNIARIFEAGVTKDGHPFFSMEYIDGLPLIEFCRNKKLGLRERLELFLQLCEGVNHFHHKGVIHRDLKPSNVLVGEVDQKMAVKIIDFGVSKAIDEPSNQFQTQVGEIVGTPSYMSPEQLSGGSMDVDTRSDIYSLGAILYELLTDVPPIDPISVKNLPFDEKLRLYRQTVPVRPGKRNAGEKESLQFRDDLDWITMTAMEKDLARRYDNVQELEQDIRNYLENKPVSVKPWTFSYQARTFFAQYKLLLGSFFMVVLALCLGLGFALHSGYQEAQARQAATQLNGILKSILAAPDPRRVGRDARIVSILENSEETLITGDLLPEIEGELRLTLSDTWSGLGAYEEALLHGETAWELYKNSLGPDHRATLNARYKVATVLRRMKNYGAARNHFEAVLAVQKIQPGKDHVETLLSMQGLSQVYYFQKEYDQALELSQETLARQGLLLPARHRDLIKTRHTLAMSLVGLKQFDEAEGHFQETLEAQKSDPLLGPDHPETYATLVNLARCLRDGTNSRLDAAAAMLRQGLEGQERTLGVRHQVTIRTRNSLLICLWRQGKYAEAADLANILLNDYLTAGGWNDYRSLQAMTMLSSCWEKSGREKDALALLDAWRQDFPNVLLQDPKSRKEAEIAIINLANLLLNDKQYERVVQVLRTSLVWDAQFFGRKRHLAEAASILASGYRALGRETDAAFYQCWVD